jgi:hypothetical protein
MSDLSDVGKSFINANAHQTGLLHWDAMNRW